jgi:hypothetical protein
VEDTPYPRCCDLRLVPYIMNVDRQSTFSLLLEVGGKRYSSVTFAYETPRRPQVSFVSKQSGTALSVCFREKGSLGWLKYALVKCIKKFDWIILFFSAI